MKSIDLTELVGTLSRFGEKEAITPGADADGVQGLQGSAFGWDFDVGALYVKSRLKNENTGYVNYDVMQAAVADGSYNIFNPRRKTWLSVFWSRPPSSRGRT